MATSEFELRRRRALYRASHRGTREMDWLLGRYAAARVDGMSEDELSRFERLLALPDPELQTWIFDPATLADSEIAPDIALVRRFHDLS